MPPQVAEGAPQLPKVGAPTPGGGAGGGPKVGGALAARMAMLQLDPTKMNPQAVADHQKNMREKEMARMEAELKAANDRRDEEMERIGRKKSVGAAPVAAKPGEAAPGQLVHAKKPKMAGRGKKAAPVRKIKFENKEQERPNVLREIQGDEMLFVQDLTAIVDKFIKPILNKGPGKYGIPPDQWDILKKLLVMKSFHERLSTGALMQQKVGDSFKENKDELLEKHKDFQQNFVLSLRVFHALRQSPLFATHLSQLAAGHPPLKVPSAYTKPLGRFREYRLLVERLLNCTNETNEEGEANKEFGLLKDALAWLKVADKATYSDYQQAEDSARLLEVQHSEVKTSTIPRDFTFFQMGRRIIRTDDMLPKGTHDPLKVYLCNDVVMWFTPQGLYKGHAPLRDVSLANEAEVLKRLNEEDRTDDAKGEIRLNIRTSAKTSGKCVFNPYPLEDEEDEKEEVKQEYSEPARKPEPAREEKKDPEPQPAAAEPVKKPAAPTAANSAMAGAGAAAAAAIAAKKGGAATTKTPPGPPAGGPKPESKEPAKPPAEAKPPSESKPSSEPVKPGPQAPSRPEKPAEPKDDRSSTETPGLSKSSSQAGLPKSQSQLGLPKSQSTVGDSDPDKASIDTPSSERASGGGPRKYKGPSFNPAPAVTPAASVSADEPRSSTGGDPARSSLPRRKSSSVSQDSAVAPPLPAEGPPAPPPPPPPPPSPAETSAGGKETALVLQCLTIRLEDKWCKAFIRAKQAYMKSPCPDTDEEQAKFDSNVRTMVSQSGGCCAIS